MEQRRVVRFILVLIAIFTVLYLLYESWWYLREHSYDKLIRSAAAQYGVSPYLVKALVWRESKFNRLCLGKAGEVGLMQVTENAAKEWAVAQKRARPSKVELFNPATNLEAGTWYLARALQRWKECDNPVPFALAEYNAGHSKVLKGQTRGASAKDFTPHIGIAPPRRYVQDVMAIEKKL